MAQQFNTKQYSWSQVDIQIGNRLLTGARGLSYTSSQEKEPVYGKGDEPQAIQRGNKAYRGELMLLQSELELLVSNAPNKDLNDYRDLSLVVAYRQEDGTVVTDAIVGAEFTELEKALRQNDKFMEVTLPFLFLKVQYDI
ncbi:hypothetical protein [Spirosoma aerolatum]|uniref:hypothetical protein n=1 Tax=Spirosoma aerolatum TaxID=1211326 RepID=UPI0009AD4377|nr:hypothetical protein [Spirosoma aerolatum]